jgi:hypothetical protein
LNMPVLLEEISVEPCGESSRGNGEAVSATGRRRGGDREAKAQPAVSSYPVVARRG